MIEHLSHNWGNWASVVGLVFSVLAFVFSKRASKAAQEARDSVLRKSLGEDMNSANRTAADIVRFVSIHRGDMALLRTGELMNETSYVIARWEPKLSAASVDNLRTAKAQLRSIHTVLTRGSIDGLSASQRARLSQACQEVNTIFSEEYGTAMKESEKED
jgi:hypothetical protein